MNPLRWWQKRKINRRRVMVEDALKHLHACEWNGHPASTHSLAGALKKPVSRVIELCRNMENQGLLRARGSGEVQLTPAGVQLALQVIRAHRLWERYLADEARMPLRHIHAEADRREHHRDVDALQALDASMGYPVTDPHGDPIPTAKGQLPAPVALPLTEWPLEEQAQIAHLEDEPATVFSQIVAVGLHIGQRIRIRQRDHERIELFDESETHILSPIVAANVFVVAAHPQSEPISIFPLTDLKTGITAVVHGLSEEIRGFTRRRLLDLGLTAGAEVAIEYTSFLGDPVALRVRGSLVALRHDQAQHVLIRTNGMEEASHD